MEAGLSLMTCVPTRGAVALATRPPASDLYSHGAESVAPTAVAIEIAESAEIAQTEAAQASP